MNILEAFDLTLPEIPAHRAGKAPPRLDPRVLAREEVEGGKAVVLAHLPGSSLIGRLSPQEWRVLQFMDGVRCYAEIAEACRAEGIPWSEEDVRELGSVLDIFLYKSPAERNFTLKQKTAGERRKIRKIKFGDLSEVEIAYWDPDQFLTRLYPWVKFMYTPWFVLSTLLAFGVMLFLCIDRWSVLWHDTLTFFNYFNKGLADLAQFYILFGIMVFFHECAHGMTCKHFGGGVRKMGFMLMYLMPAFFCDASEVYVYGGRWPRIATMAAGVWVDMIFCVPATIVWWATPVGMPLHDFAYKIMLLTGIVISLMQLNPLIKLDGYFIFCELIQIGDLMQASTAYFDSWVRRNIFRLAVEIEPVPRRRRMLFFTYALLSRLYSITLLSFFSVFAYHIFRSYSPEWAFIPAMVFGYLVFRSRIMGLVRLLRASYLDHKEQLKRNFALGPAAVAALVLALLVAPLWRQTVEARLILQPVERVVVRSEVSGQVQQVLAEEGQPVEPGNVLVRLENLDLRSRAADIATQLQIASARATQSQLQYLDPAAVRERQELAEENQTIGEEVKKLQVVSPIAGIVLTPRLQDLQGRYLLAGTEIAEVADLSVMQARVFVPEFSLRDVRVGAPVRLLLAGRIHSTRGTVTSISPSVSPVPTILVEKTQYAGISPPQYYMAMVSFHPPTLLAEGLTGTAKILVRRRSLVSFGWMFFDDMLARKFW
ncbi:MAG TPA: HlyD family efflux transporter periplasmic adaptor subunit [Terriglobales bacterium]|nr:HlyD family efflux transporter periplasmic adaptor subunit [Terriglobales bacterium]